MVVNNKIIRVRLVKWQLQPSNLTRAPDETNHALNLRPSDTHLELQSDHVFHLNVFQCMPSHGFYEYLSLQWIWQVICVFQSRTTLAHTVFLFLKERYLTPLPALGCVAMSKSQTFLWWGCRLLKFTGQALVNWNRMVSEQGFYTQTQHNGHGWTKTSNHLLNQATLSHCSTTQSLKYPHLYFSATAQYRH